MITNILIPSVNLYMKTLLLSTSMLLSSAMIASAQAGSPAPTPPSEDVVKISTNLIQIDVTVTDKKGDPIKDLRPDEIEIYENGKRQAITNFSLVSSGLRVRKDPSKKGKDTDPMLPPPPVRPENVRRTVALVVDDLNLSFGSANSVQHAVKKFVNEQMQEGDLVAIIRTGTGIGALQQFTTDKRQLLKAAEKIRFNMSGSARIGVFNPIDPTLMEEMGTEDTPDLNERARSDREFEQEVNDFRESVFVSGTLGAINYVIRGMKNLPGRKSVVLIMDGLRLSLDSDRGTDRVVNMLRQLTDVASRSSVVIYTIDARGLESGFLTAEDNVAGMSSEQIDAAVSGRQQDLRDSQDGLRFLAYATGGTAYVNQNDISYGIRKVLDDQSYYLVGYEPDSATFDPKTAKYNKLVIKVNRPDVKVRYRSGFFGVSEEKLAEVKKAASPLQTLYDALTSPFAENQVPVRLNALVAAGADRSMHVRSLLHIDADKLSFQKGADGRHTTSFDIVISTFGDNGAPVEGERSKFNFSVSDEGLALVRRTGLIHNFVVPVKKPGAYQLRVAVRDTSSNQVGSAYQFIEVPNLKKNRLTLSGVLLENVDLETWKKLDTMTPDQAKRVINPLADTAIRQFKPGTVLTYTVNIYNARTDKEQRPNLTIQANIYDEKELVFGGKPANVAFNGPVPADGIPARGTMRFGNGFAAGNYTLQLTVTDNNAKGGRKVATQFVPFEIVK